VVTELELTRLQCDEHHPICDRCKAAGLRCSFADLRPALPASPRVDFEGHHELPSRNEPDSASSVAQFSARDMALLHQYIISTSLTLSRDRSFQKLYQTTAVHIGISEPFLLHGILAIAALHLAQTLPGHKQEHSTEAAKHHDLALTLYQEALKDLGPKRYDAIFLSASLLFMFVFAYVVGNPSDATFPPGDAAEFFLSFRWVRIARGIRIVRTQGQQWLISGPLWPVLEKILLSWPMLRDPSTNINLYDLDPPCPEELRLTRLKEMWQKDISVGSGQAEIYSEAHHSLLRAYRRTHQRQKVSRARHDNSGNEEFVQSLGWLAELSDSFVSMLEEHDPPALVLMCHYTRLLDTISFSFWWTHRNSQVCASRIQRILPIKWHKWLNLE
jgi:hypothetical protein